MANRRLLSKSISTSFRINKLSEFAQLLFTWMIPHTDDFGRVDGNPEVIKALVMPFSKRKPEDFVKAIKQMEEFGLISWYEESQKIVIEVVNSDEHQSGLLSKRTKSRFPNRTESSKNFSEFLGTSQNYLSNLTKPNLTKPNLYLSGKPDPHPQVSLKKEAGEVLEFLNMKMGRNYRLVDTNIKLVEARLQSGISLQDLKCIIAKKCREWRDNPKMEEYLRPKTLFNKVNCEQYLGELHTEEAPNENMS